MTIGGTIRRAGARCFSMTAKQAAPDKSRFVPKSGVYPKGFSVGGAASGVKKNGASDLALLVSSQDCSAAAIFTQNVFKAAPVVVDKDIMENTKGKGIRAIVVNSGCANAVTGQGGIKDAKTMVDKVDELLGIHDGSRHTLVMSTGVIGQKLSMDKIVPGIENVYKNHLGSDHEHWLSCAKAIMTTDSFPKLVSKQFKLDGTTYTIAGLAKGAGMIHPNMATMLSYFVTDAAVEPTALQKALKYAADRSFNAISVDGDMSTNDTLAALANGAAAPDSSALITESSPGFTVLQDIFVEFAQELSQLIVRDGEGATKLITIEVTDALSFDDAKQVASTIATSALVKCAMYGGDANWGRILCATGYAGVEVDPYKTNVSFIPTDGSPELKLLVNGEPEEVDEERASEILKAEDLHILVSLGTGGGQSAKYWTCDFTHEYVTINGDYRT